MIGDLKNSTERPSKLEGSFLLRYNYAAKLAKGKKVLDIGTGLGLGASLMAKKGARQVLGIDNSPLTIKQAVKTYHQDNLKFLRQDAISLSSLATPFDLVVAYELIEHLPPNQFDQFIDVVSRIMKKTGLFLISTPNKLVTSPNRKKPLNPYHTKEFSPSELSVLLKRHFSRVQIMGIKCVNSNYLQKQKKVHNNFGFQIASFLTGFKFVAELATYIPQHLKQKITSIDTLPVLTEADFVFTRDYRSSECLFAECRFG